MSQIYTGDDSKIFLTNLGVDFADLVDLWCNIVINEKSVKIYKKSESDAEKRLDPVVGEAQSCSLFLYRSETKDWESPSQINAELTFIVVDPDFPDGKHIGIRIKLCDFRKFLSASIEEP